MDLKEALQYAVKQSIVYADAMEECEKKRSQAGNLLEFFQFAEEAIEKQIPQRPKEIDSPGISSFYECASCKRAVLYMRGLQYCSFCGQKFDFSQNLLYSPEVVEVDNGTD